MVDDLRLELRSDPQLLSCVRSLSRSWLQKCECPDESVDEMVLAIDEACANAIRHSYRGDCERSVVLTMRADDDFVEIRLCDEGDPCPPEHVERRALEPPDPENLQPGGLGVHLIYGAFDEVEFCPGRDVGNCVILRKRRGGQ